jgi:hypothetical protein
VSRCDQVPVGILGELVHGRFSESPGLFVKSRLSRTRFENCGVTIGRMHGAPDDLEVLTMGRVSVDRNQRDELVMVATHIPQL